MADEALRLAGEVTASKIAKYGSISKWPYLALLPNQFPVCQCGKPRGKHLYFGVDLLGPVAGDCVGFKAVRRKDDP